MSAAFSAGQRVRVSDGAASSRRALLLCLHAEGCDVEFEGTDEEESNVRLSRITTLLDFEVGSARGATESANDTFDTPPAPARAEQHKQQGNQLFKLHDHAAAAEEYAAGLRALRLEARLSTGARCLVKPAEGGGKVRGALLMVLNEDEGTADLLFEATSCPPLATLAEGLAEGEEAEEAVADVDEEEDGVPVARLIAIHPRRPALQCALSLNLARCSLVAQDWAVGLARARRAEVIAAHDTVEPLAAAPLRRTGLFLSARAALGMQRFGQAASLTARLMAAAPEGDDPADVAAAAAVRRDARLLLREIQTRSAEVRRSNKRLAQAVGKWVATAMEQVKP